MLLEPTYVRGTEGDVIHDTLQTEGFGTLRGECSKRSHPFDKEMLPGLALTYLGPTLCALGNGANKEAVQ